MTKKTLAFLRGSSTDRVTSGWLRMSELPIGATLTRRLISEGFLESIVVASPGSKRGVRLVSQESLDRYFKSLLPKEAAAKQGTAKRNTR